MLKKLSQKASGTTSEETVLVKSFKYFDLNNNGTIEADEFGKAIKVKCLVNLGVSYDLPPPGAPQAHIKAVLSISFQKNALRSYTPL